MLGATDTSHQSRPLSKALACTIVRSLHASKQVMPILYACSSSFEEDDLCKDIQA